jgi:ribosomal protein S18 acetylase RimI-like enzyme
MVESNESSKSAAPVRRAEPADALLLAELGARLFEQAFGDANEPSDMTAYLSNAFSITAQSAELADEHCVIWIAEDANETAIGYALLNHGGSANGVVGEATAEVQRIYVDRASHGRGAGDALMQMCVEQARAWECDVLWLGVWEENPRAIAFYKKNGFLAVGTQTFVLGHDIQRDIVMTKMLG